MLLQPSLLRISVAIIFLLSFSALMHAQTPQKKPASPRRFGHNQLEMDAGGHYTGVLYNDAKTRVFSMDMTIDASSEWPEGTVTFMIGGNSITSKLKIAKPWYNRDGSFRDIEFGDNATISETGNEQWCGKTYSVTDFEFWQDSLVLQGTWLGSTVYIDKQWVKDDNGLCSRGTFRVAKAVDNSKYAVAMARAGTGCISGDCQNGEGEQTGYNFAYKGHFKNGLREGQGTYVYTSGQQKGNRYEGQFSNGDFNGFGKMVFAPNMSGAAYYEGYFVNGMRQGKGTMVQTDGGQFIGEFRHNYIHGIGRQLGARISQLRYYDGGELSGDQGLPLETLKYHQDTMFAKFKKCDCLTRKTFTISGWEYHDVKYDVFNAYTGNKVGETTKNELGDNSLTVKGFINSSTHNVYIRCYRRFLNKKTNVQEYIDDAYVVSPGQEIMSNYRVQPQGGELYYLYFANDFVYAGQFCEKDVTDCKIVPAKK